MVASEPGAGVQGACISGSHAFSTVSNIMKLLLEVSLLKFCPINI